MIKFRQRFYNFTVNFSRAYSCKTTNSFILMDSKRKRSAVDNNDSISSSTKRAKSDLGQQWEEFGSATSKGLKPLIYSTKEMICSDKIAGFDLDDTLITTASGKKFPTGPNDWKFWSGNVPEKLRSISKEGYKVVIFTNQGGIEKKKTTAKDLKTKISNIIAKIGIDIQVFISTGENQFRKPSSKVWDFMQEKCNNDITIDKSKSYYVGDAAGRAKGWAVGKSKDFSCSDRKFAANIGIDFHTPEEYFLGHKKALFEWGSKSPSDLLDKEAKNTDYSKLVSSKKVCELVLLIGPPASGKSTISRKYFASNGYVVVNRDLLKTQDKCLKTASEALKSGKGVVVDNTNPSKESRASYVKLAKNLGCPVRCIWLQTSFELARHLNLFRQTQSEGEQRRVPDVGFNMYKSKFETPSLNEGFSVIEKIHFKPEFDSTGDEKLFGQWS